MFCACCYATSLLLMPYAVSLLPLFSLPLITLMLIAIRDFSLLFDYAMPLRFSIFRHATSPAPIFTPALFTDFFFAFRFADDAAYAYCCNGRPTRQSMAGTLCRHFLLLLFSRYYVFAAAFMPRFHYFFFFFFFSRHTPRLFYFDAVTPLIATIRRRFH